MAIKKFLVLICVAAAVLMVVRSLTVTQNRQERLLQTQILLDDLARSNKRLEERRQKITDETQHVNFHAQGLFEEIVTWASDAQGNQGKMEELANTQIPGLLKQLDVMQ